jgi:hypothetical protein
MEYINCKISKVVVSFPNVESRFNDFTPQVLFYGNKTILVRMHSLRFQCL